MDKWLNRATNIALIVLSVAAITVMAERLTSDDRPSAPVATVGYRPGDQIVDGRTLGLKGRTLLIATKSTCQYCTQSLPFYKSLAGRGRIVWIAVGETVDLNRSYLQGHGIDAALVVTVAESRVANLRSTPTVIVVDKEGKYVNSWIGALGPAGEADVISNLEGA